MKKKIMLLFLVCIITTMLYFNFSIVFVSGNSMLPTYENNSILVICKTCRDIKRNDVIVFSRNNIDIYVKRVIGTPNQTIYCKDKIIYINDKHINDTFQSSTNNFENITLGSDEYFVLGDNRIKSSDSRIFGPINENKIIGKVIFKIK